MMSKTTNRFSPGVRARAVRLVFNHEKEPPLGGGRGQDRLHGADAQEWVKKAEVDSGCAGLPAEVAEKLKALERENRELRQANEILRKGSAYFARAELELPVQARDRVHRRSPRGAWVEPSCKVLPIAPSTYHDHVAKRRDE